MDQPIKQPLSRISKIIASIPTDRVITKEEIELMKTLIKNAPNLKATARTIFS